jgi:tetratricopeptide (TPR) repeat protein/serine/threonine protein kinase
MKQSEDWQVRSDRNHAVELGTDESVHYEPSAAGLEDPCVIRALEEYRAALEAGRKPDRDEFLARYPQIARSLAECIDGLDFVHMATPQLSQPAAADPAFPAAEIQPEGPLGDFRIIREVGRGGMGVVYEATQISLGRRVALKVLPFAAAMDPKQLQRFKNEAQAAALLHHTNIVPVFAVGCERGVHYYAMQYIKGEPLDRVIQNLRRQQRAPSNAFQEEQTNPPTAAYSPTPPASASPSTETSQPIQAALSTERSITSREFFQSVARLGIQAAEGLDHAHQQGILHRDIKPANLLLDVRDNLWIADFGLARFQNDTRLSMTGDLVGTLRYMSPEQALAKRVVVDHRTDVYSLGVTLYELLTLEPAFRGSDREEVLRQIAFEESRPPRRLNRLIPAELETIVLKAMEKNPADRYATAQELADDLRRFLEDKPICAKRPTVLRRAAKWRRRHPAVVWSAALITLILASSLGWIFRDWQARRTEAEGRVVEALQMAEPKLREGNPHDPVLIAAAQKAEAHLASGIVRDELRQRVEQVLADLKMLGKLEEIRLAQAEVKEDHFDTAGADPAYTQAFQEYGISVEQLGAQEAGAWIRQRAIGLYLAAALDNWANARKAREKKGGGTSWKQLLEVAREADLDPWRCALRKAQATQRREDLERVLKSAPSQDLPPSTLAVLGHLGYEGGSVAKLAVAVLRQGQQRHPADFWVNHGLALCLKEIGQPREAIRFYTAALALRPESPGVYVNLGLALKDSGALDDAIAACKEAIRLKPEYALAYVNLGAFLCDKGAWDEAFAHFKEAICFNPASALANGNLGLALAHRGALDEAIAAYREAIRLNPDNPDSYYNMGNALKQKGALDDAMAAYQEAIRIKPGYSEAYNHLGLALDAKGAVEEAIAAYRKAIRLRPDNGQAYNNLGEALLAKGAVHEAIAAYKEAIRLEPNSAIPQHNLGSVLRKKGALDEAIAAYKEAIRLEPDFADTYNNLGNALQDKGAVDEAIAAFKEAIRLKPDHPFAHGNLGISLQAKGALDEAIAAYKEAIRRKPDHVEALNNLGMVLSNKGAFDESIAAFKKALTLKPDHVDALNNLGITLCQKGAVDEGITMFKKAIDLKPDAPLYHCTLGKALAQKGQHEEAIASFREAIRHDDHFVLADSELGFKLAEKNRLDEAIACFRRVIDLNKHDVSAHNNLGCVLARKGQPDEAIACYREALRIDKNWATAHENLGERFYHKGRWADAEASYREALRLAPNAASSNSSLAWFRANCPDARFRNVQEAVQLAVKATELGPSSGENWLALGVARFRAGRLQEAAAALEKATGLRPRENSTRLLFLAMTHWQLGDKEKAREFYSQAAEWLNKNQPEDPEELRRFRTEARAILNLRN